MFNKELQLNIGENMIDDCYRLGKNRNRRPVLMSFTSTLIRDHILDRAKLLKGTRIFLEKDYDFKTRSTRAQLMPFMKEARSKGKHAFLREDKLVIDGKEVDIHYCNNNLKTR